MKNKTRLKSCMCSIFGLTLGLLSWQVKAQTLTVPVVEVDSITHAIKEQIPFDRKFILKIKAAAMPTSVDYIQLRRNMTWYQTIHSNLTQRRFLGLLPPSTKGLTLDRIDAASIDTGREGGKKYAYIQFDAVADPKKKKITENNYLKPGKAYAVIVSTFDEQTSSIFQAYFDSESSGGATDFTKGDSIINAYHQNQVKKYAMILNEIKTNSAHALYNTALHPFYLAIRVLDDSVKKRGQTVLLNSLDHSVLLRRVIKTFTEPVPQLHIPAKYVDSLAMLNNLQLLYHAKDALITGNKDFSAAFFSGQATMTAPAGKTGVKLDKQIKNIKASIAAMQQIAQYTGLLFNRDLFTDQDSSIKNIRFIQNLLQKQLDDLLKKDELTTKINQAIAKKPEYVQFSVITGSSVTFDFKTRSKLQIIPDFGYVWYGFQPGFSSFTPYLGFHINLRPIDKNIPWNIYPNKTLWHYLSFSTGWTLTSLAKSGQRENFFSSSALLTGMGIKLTNALKINTGVTWFYRNDPNPVLSNRSLRCTPFAGLSIDLDVKEFLNDFTSKVPNLK